MTTYNLLLVDSRLSDIDTILQSLNAETIGIVFQYDSDVYNSITDNIKNRLLELETETPEIPLHVQAVGILQHNYKTSIYQFVASEPDSTLDNVFDADPQLETWKPFSEFIRGLISQYGITTLDLMACALYSDANWKYVIDTLATNLQIDIRASTDNTGSEELGGNWFLETGSGVNLTTIYFTEEIYKWKYSLATFPNYFVIRNVRDGYTAWRNLIPNLVADTTTAIETWGPDQQFWDVGFAVDNQIAKQFSYFAGYWLNVNKIKDSSKYSVSAYHFGSAGIFTFWATAVGPVTAYKGTYSTYNTTEYQLTPQTDGINAGIAAATVTPTLTWSSSPPSVANISNAGPYSILATSASSGAVSYHSSNPGVASISGGNLTLVAFGTTTITASQAADPANYYTAPANLTVILTVLRTPVFNTALMTQITRDFSHINTTFTATAPANSAFTPNLVSPTFTYSVEYLTNSAYANANLKTAEFVTPSSSTCTVRNSGQCYLKVTTNQNLASFLDVATANFTLLTVRAGYIVGPNVDLSGALIQNYDLTGTNLSGVNFTNARLINCILDGVNMTSANFTGATFTYNRINSTTNLTSANFTDLVSNNISGTTTQISNVYAIQSGQIVASGTILFAITFTLVSPSATLPTTPTLGGKTGYYEVYANSFLVNGRPETSTVASNLIAKAINTEYVLTQVGITPTPSYKFAVFLNGSDSKIYVRGINISTNATVALPNVTYTQTFAVAFLVTTPLPTYYYLKGSYIFGPNMSLAGVYFDNTINPKPDLTDLSFVNLTLSNRGTSTSSQLVLQGWKFTRSQLHSGNFGNISFQDCICIDTDFSGSNLSNSSFVISYDSAISAVPNTATMLNTKFTNATITDLTLAGFNNNLSVSANQMNVNGLDFSGCTIDWLKSYFLAGTPLRLKNAYGGPAYTMLTDSLIGRFIAGPTMNLSGLTLGNVAFSGTNFASSNIYGTKLSASAMTGITVSNGRLTYSSLTTTLPSNFKIVNPLLSAQTVQYDVTNSGTGAYVINGQNNLTLVLTRGARYAFNISASGHPFWIKTAATTGTGNAYSTGVTNNGISSGIGVTTFIVPLDAPNPLYYQCELHASMGGTLTISDEINTYPTYIIGPGADLSGANASGVVFTGANISGAIFTNAIFTNVVSGQLIASPARTNALNFDGNNDYVTLGIPAVCYEPQFRTTMTIECWFKTTDTNDQKETANFVSRWSNGGTNAQFLFGMNLSGQVRFIGEGVAGSVSVLSPLAYKDTQWHHAAVTFNSTTNNVLNLYIDGVSVNTSTNTTILLNNNSTLRLIIGSDDRGLLDRQFRGSIADVRIWNVVRSPAEIFNNYTKLLLGNEPGLILYNKLDQGTANGNNVGTTTAKNDMLIGGAAGTLENFSLNAGSVSNWVDGPIIKPLTLPNAQYSIVSGYFVGPYVDLSGSNFVGQSLANTNLTGVNFTNSNLTGVMSGGISSTATIAGVTTTVAPTLATGYGLTGGYIVGPNMNFTGADLSGFDFTNVNLSGTIFTGANITYVKSGNTLSSGGTTLPDANYVFLNNFLLGPKVNLSSKDLSGINLYNLTLSGSLLVNTNLSYADISGTVIDGVNFTGATFTRTRSRNIPQPTVAPTFTAGTAGGYVVRSGYLIGANVDLSNVNFTGLDLSNTVLTNVNLSNAIFINTRSGGITVNNLLPPSLPAKYKVLGGYLHGPRVDLSGANLTSYDFSTQASSVNWSLANLTNATFTNMKSGWITIDSVGNDSSGPILSFPYVYNRLVSANPSGGFIIGPNVDLTGAPLTNYDLRSVVDITGVNFTNAALTGVKTSGAITANAGNRPTFTSGSGYVLYAGRIFGPGVDVSGTDLSGLFFGTSTAAVAAGSTSALSATNFTNANLSRTSFYGSVVTGTLFTGATFFRTRTGGLSFVTTAPAMPTPDYRYVNTDVSGGYIIGPNVDLSGTNLRGAIFDNTNFKNVDMSGALITNSTSINLTFDASTNLPQGYKFITNSSQVSFIAGPNISLAGKSLDGAIIANVDLTNTNLTNAGALATTFSGTRSGGITFTSGNPPLFQTGSGYQIRGGYIVGPGVDLSNITVGTLAAANGVAYGAGLFGIDLSGTNLAFAKFTGSDLSGADLSGTTLSFTDFSGANFINIKSGGKITFTTQPTLPSESYRVVSNGYSESSPAFQRYIIGPGAKCRGADLSGAVFSRVDLSGIDFTGANFTRVSSGIMRNQPITSSLPTGFQLVVGENTQTVASQDPSYNNATYFVGPTAILTGAFFKNASIVNCDITGANFTNADFTNLYSRGVTNSPSTPATMPNASYFVKGGYIFGPTVNLSGGDFTGLDLSGSSLIRSTMRNANFTNVNLTNANITNADLSGSTLTGATTVRVTYQGYNYGGDFSLQDPTFPAPYRFVYSADAGYGCIIGPYVVLSGADLRGSNLAYTNITGANLVGANITGVRSGNIAINNGNQPIFTPGSGFKILSGYLIGPYADLTNIVFTDQDFSGTNLTGTNFTNSVLLNVKSGNIVATPVLPIFPDTTFSLRGGYIIGPGVDLSNSDLSGIDLSNATVTNANMVNSNFVNVRSGGVKGTTPLLKPSYMQRNGYIIGAGVDLSGADLSGQNLGNAVFSDANITNMVFTNTILTGVRSGGNMRYSALTTSRLPAKYTIRGTYIVGPSVDLSGGNFTGLDISNTFLSGANFSAVNFTGMRSGGIEMITTNPIVFSEPTFYNGSEYGYNYLNGYIVGPGVNLSGADFSGVNISAVDVSGANMSNVVLTRIRSSNVVGVPSAITTGYKVTARHIVGPRLDMSGYDFTNGNFSGGVDISGSNLTNAIFTNTSSGGVTGSSGTLFTTTTLPANIKYQLTRGYIVGPSVDLTNSDLSGVDVSGINLTGATLYNAVTGKVIHNAQTVLPSVDYTFIGDYIVGPNVNLSLVDFSGADLRYTNLTNVDFGSANLTNVRSGYIIGTPRQLPPAFSFITGYIVGPSTDLSGADLSGGNLSGCNIQGADLTNINFYNVQSGGVTGTPRVPLTTPYTITPNGYLVGPNVNLSSANLASINLQGLNLTNAIMTGATFTNAKFGDNIGPPRSLTAPFIYVQTELSGGYVVGPYIDLSRANLSYANITRADLTGVNLGTAVFYRTRSGNMNAFGAPSALPANYSILPTTVSGGYLIGPNVDLTDANFSGSGTVLTGRNISGALMERIVFNGTRIGGGGLIGPPGALSADYRYIESSLSGGYIIGPNIDLSGANFKNTDISFVRVDGVNFTNANFTNTITGRLISSSASLSPTVLTSPYRLIMSTLSGGYIMGPNVNMSGANLAFTDISNTVLTGVNLTNASFTRTKSGLLTATAGSLPTLSPSYRYVTTTSSGGYIVGPTMDLTRANLAGSDLSRVSIYGCDISQAILPSTLTYIRSGGLVNANPPAVLPSPYLFITNEASGAYIVGPFADLSGANLEGSVLTNTDISSADFTGARLKYVRSGGMVNGRPPATLPSPYLFITNDASGAYIVGPYADLSGANLESSIITGADISSADFTNARLRYVRSGGMPNTRPPATLPAPYNFITNDVSGAYLIGPFADLSGANLESSVLTNTDISSANFTNARLRYVRSGGMVNSRPPATLPAPYKFVTNDASGAYIVGPFADLSGANLEGSVLTGADLSGADFTRARLKYVRSGGMVNSRPPAVLPSPYLFITNDASGAYIVGPFADLSGANLEGSVLTNTDISSADFTRARLKYVRSGGMVNAHPPVNIPSPYLFITNDASGAYIVGPYADLSGANLEGSVITGADISSADFTGARLRDLKSGNLSAAGRPAVLPTTYTFNVSATSGYGGYIIGTGVNISGAVLDGTDLSGVVFTDANMQGMSLAGGGTSLVNVRSGGIRGIPASLPPGYNFVNDNSSGGYIVGRSVDLSGANLTNCVLMGLDVSGANLTGAIMVNAMTGPNLIGPPAFFPSPAYNYIVSSASGGFIIGPDANIEGANLTGVDLSGFNFKGMNITGVDFSGTNLINVKSGGTVGPPSRLPSPYVFMTDNSFGAYIVGPRVDLSGVNLTNCRFTGLNISGASFTNAVLINVKSGGGMIGPPAPGSLPPKYRFVVDNSLGGGGDGTGGYFIGPGVDLSGASLRNQIDSELNLSGAYFTDANITNARFSGSAMPRVKSGGMTGLPASLPNAFTFVVSASGGYFIGPYSDLTNANLNSTVLTGMNITHADLTGATFTNTLTGALIGPPDAIAAGYHYVVRSPAPALDAYIMGPRVNLTNAVLNGTNLTDFDLSGANLTNAVFTGTNFTNTNIFGSNLTGAAAFTNMQRVQLLKNSNNRGITKAQVTQCLGGEIDIIAATSTTPNTNTYNPIYDYIRDITVDILTSDPSGNSNLSRYTGRAFYIPSSPGESFYVDASATGPLIVTPSPINTPQYYYDQGRGVIIETATENTIRTISVGGRIFLVFGGSMLGLLIDDVYSAVGFPPIYKTYAYYGVRNMIPPPQIPVVHAVSGNGQMSLNWEPSFSDGKPRLGYVIEYTTQRPVANLYSNWIVYSEQYALTNVTIFGLTNGATYYIRVAAINSVGRGLYSPVAEIVPGTTPNTVTTLFVNGGNNALTLEWVAPYDQGYIIKTYTIKYKVISGNQTDDDSTAFTVITVSATGLTTDATKRTCAYTLTQAANGIVNGITYDVRIAAVNDIGSGEFGAMSAPNPTFAIAGIRPDIIIAATINSSLVVENMGGKVRLSWLPPAVQGDSSVYTYSIQSVEVAVGAGVAPPTIADASWNVISPATYTMLPDNARGNGSVYTVISGFANGKSYTFRIAAVSGIGRGPYSQPIPAVVPGSVPSPLVAARMGVTVDIVEGAKLTLFWNAVNTNGYTVTAYRARIRTDAVPITWSESPIISVPSGIVNTLPYRNQIFLGLTNGREYYMGVAAQNALGWSEYSETIVETPRTVPQPPPSITAAPLNEALRVQWAGNGASDGGYPVIGYRLQYKPNIVSSAGWVDIDLSGIYITNHDIMNLNNGITYNLRVLRRNAIGFSSPSLEISGIPGTVSGPPINLFLSPGPQHIDAYWQPPVDVGTNTVDYYYVQYKLTTASDSEYVYLNNDAGTAPKQITEFSTIPNAPGYDGYVASIINISNGVSYSLRVAAVTRVGLGAWSAPYTSTPGTVPSQIE